MSWQPEEDPCDSSGSQAGSHGNDVAGQPGCRYGFEGAQLTEEVEHPPIALPQLAENSPGT